MTQHATHLADHLAAHFANLRVDHVAVAVSGGSDSLGLLMLARTWSQGGGPRVHAVTVDHGLRPESAAEAENVAALCARYDIAHQTLRWAGWDGAGNLPDKARQARYGLMADWARDQGIGHVLLGHTMDDQAETLLMRLAREAGVDGLAAMASRWEQGGVGFHRPVLGLTRDDLRGLLRDESIAWVEDPSNVDDALERARVRKALAVLEPLGITRRGLSTVARHMSDVRATLYWYVFMAARSHMRMDQGDVLLDRKGFRTLPRDVARRLVQSVLMWISGAPYAPRGKAVDLMLEAIRGGTGMTLQGVILTVGADTLRLSREFKAVEQVWAYPGASWDGRWQVDGPWPDGARIAALGEEGWLQCKDRAQTTLPLVSLLASPAVWRDGHLVAAPLAGVTEGWSATLLRDEDAFFAKLLAH